MLELFDLTVRFGKEGSANAVEEISLKIEDREKVFLIGETGSGKSVLLMAILGMLPDSAVITGRAVLDGRDILNLPEKEMRRIRGTKIAYIPQGSGEGMNPLLRAGYQIGEPRVIHQKERMAQAIRAAAGQLERFGLKKEVLRQYPHTLSGGMKQRSLIVMGVMEQAPVLFADEPTKGLDPARILQIVDCFAKLKEQTLLCVTHDLRFAQAAAEKICVLYASQAVEYSEKEEFFKKPLHPYSQAILQALPENGLQVSEGFAPPREDADAQKGCHYRDAVGSAVKMRRNHRCLRSNTKGQVLVMLIEAENLRKDMEEEPICHRWSVLSIECGETVGIMGESGGSQRSGRFWQAFTRRQKAVSGFAERAEIPYKRSCAAIQILFQHPEVSFNPRMKLEESLCGHLLKKKRDRTEFLSYMKRFGIYEEHVKRYPAELSGGELQRMALARAMLMEPECLILDEPTSMLDMVSQAQMIRLLERLQAETGVAYLFISHDRELCRKFCSRIHQLEQGRFTQTWTRAAGNELQK
ncbi:MAG: ABC transporter ATP-binding protein [Lachnospiraceae bacterium]